MHAQIFFQGGQKSPWGMGGTKKISGIEGDVRAFMFSGCWQKKLHIKFPGCF